VVIRNRKTKKTDYTMGKRNIKNSTLKTKDWAATRTEWKTRDELRCSGSV